ncbi:MAG: class I SAM-dependent DNA methyltransferase [Bacillota bacterium]
MGSQSYTSSFASIYDDIMGRVPYYYWHKYLRYLLSYYNKDPKYIMELACGTGNMLKYFVKDVEEIYGLDKSEDMLTVAQNKLNQYQNVKLFQTDMSKEIKYGDFDFIYSIFDSMNYVLKYDDLIGVFKNAYLNLKSEGIFVFDINTLYRLMELNEGTNKIDGKNYTCYWKDIVDKEQQEWIIELNIYLENNGELENFTERHIEKGYSIKDIEEGLSKAGFLYIDHYRSFTFKKGDPHNDRLHFVALKKDPEIKKIKQIFLKFKWNIVSLFISNF